MAKDLVLIPWNRPGALANIGEILGNVGINIEVVCAVPFRSEGGKIHI